MLKITPTPPETDDVSPYETPESKKLNQAADRALDFYLKPVIPQDTPRKPSTIYFVGADTNDETLLVSACETMASASVMLSEFAGQVEGTQRIIVHREQARSHKGSLVNTLFVNNTD